MLDNCLLIFVKAPIPGKVKTRLAASVGDDRATELYMDMARSVYQTVKEIPNVFIAPAYASHARFPDLVWLDRSDPGYIEQRGDDLGARMLHAFDWAWRSGAKRICAIGVDSPGLDPHWVEEAFEALKQREIVLGPVEDGGYYLIGMHRVHKDLFSSIEWSSPRVFQQTVEAAKRAKLTVHELPGYFDVDDEATLNRWLEAARRASGWAMDPERERNEQAARAKREKATREAEAARETDDA